MVKIVARHMIYLMSKTLSLLRILSLGQMLSVLVLITGMQLLVRQILLRLAAKKQPNNFHCRVFMPSGHLVASEANDTFIEALSINIESIIIDLNHWFNKSSKNGEVSLLSTLSFATQVINKY